MAGASPAAFLKLDGELGHIEPGYRASLVLADERFSDPRNLDRRRTVGRLRVQIDLPPPAAGVAARLARALQGFGEMDVSRHRPGGEAPPSSNVQIFRVPRLVAPRQARTRQRVARGGISELASDS